MENRIAAAVGKPGPVPAEHSWHICYGATCLLKAFAADELRLTADLRSCFSDTCRQLFSIVFYLKHEDNNLLYRIEKWDFIHWHPFGEDIHSPRCSELFSQRPLFRAEH
ncbi:hypothetical protein AALB39_15290 [Lachnospiraceae bacterium 54-53]